MFYRKMLKSKIHRARITDANLEYEGSITIAPELLKASNIIPNESVSVWNVTNGARFETYAISGKQNSSTLCVNGAAARLVSPGDLVIIASFVLMTEEECRKYAPIVIFVDHMNKFKEIRQEEAIDIA